jgi:TonB-linked SusC/RagA family outer membrane protein
MVIIKKLIMRRYVALFIIYLLCAGRVQAQMKAVRGIVRDGNTPLASATVWEKEIPNNGTVTDEKGAFRITLRGKKKVLVIKSIGYLQKEVTVSGPDQFNIQLTVDSKGMEDVVVVGYGTQKKITNTGAISSISGDQIRQSPSASLQNALMGRLPGFESQQRSGQPGSDGAAFKIRGLNTFSNDGTPLVIVDDVVFNGSISDIDADQVASLTILKDASATAVYGIKGANGVVVITTRHGESGRPKVSFRSETGAQTPDYQPKFLNAYQTAKLYNQALSNDSLPLYWSDQDIALFKSGADPYGHPNVDWWHTLLRPFSLQNRNNLDISGGTDKVKYFVSLGYLWQDGQVRDFSSSQADLNSQFYYKRYNFRSNLDIQATKNLSLTMNVSGSFGEQNQPHTEGRADNLFFELTDYTFLPVYAYPIYNPNGSYGGNNSGMLAAGASNIVGRLALEGYERTFSNEMTVNLRAKQNLPFITKGLSVQALLGYDNINSYVRNMTREGFPSYDYNSTTRTYTPYDPTVHALPPLTLTYTPGSMNKVLDFQGSINYDRNFGDHHAYALLLANEYANSNGATAPANFRGYTFRGGYDYKHKYMLEVNGAYNGTDRFQANKRYGLFPAVSGGWNIAEEPFFRKAVPFIDLFKIRGSYGLVGSDLIGGYQYIYQQVYNRTGTYSIGQTSRTINGIVEGTLGNTDVTWEQERSEDFGTDMAFFKGKLNLTADYFNRYRYDILVTRKSVPVFTGMTVPPVNLGRMRDRGFEVSLTYRGKAGKVGYSVNGNVSYAKNKILFEDEPAPAYPWLRQTGGPFGREAGYLFQGFYQSAQDVAASPKPLVAAKPGDLKYRDVNGDGVININDQVLLPYANLPTTIYGFNGDINYKGFSLHFTLQAATQFTFRGTGADIEPFSENPRQVHLNTWTPENTHPLLPRLSTQWSSSIDDPWNSVSDFWLRRSDYLRLKNVEIGYEFPRRWFHHGVTGLRVYANGYNLLTWMLVQPNIYNIDPESNSDGSQMTYPQQKIYNFGLQVSF